MRHRERLEMEERIRKALRSVEADYAEVHLEERRRTRVDYHGRELESVGTNLSYGGNVRSYRRGGWGFVSYNDPDTIEECMKEACSQADLSSPGQGSLAESSPVTDELRLDLEDDPREVCLEEKEALARSYNETILKGRSITTSRVLYEDTFLRRWFYNTDGSSIVEERIYCGIHFGALAKDGTNVQRSFDSVGGTGGYSTVQRLQQEVERVTQEACDLLRADKVEAGRYTVVVDPKLAGVFAHEAFGHLSEADFLYENERLKEILTLGETFGPPNLSIVDDGTIPGERGYYQYDDEGVPARKTYLIRDGVLVGRLHSRETAARMAEPLSGNARAISYRFPPIVRMSCTYIEPRDKTFDDMVAEVDRGLYVKDSLGGQTELELFTFSSLKAYLIEGGKIGPMVRDVVLSGNVFETLKNIDAIGDDLCLCGGLGGCGKEGQAPLPVSDGSPHIRIRNVVIGGA